jgi:hypothetical protein
MKETTNYNTPLEAVNIYTNALNERSKHYGYNLNYATGFMWTTLRDIINEHPQVSDILLEKINDLNKLAEYPNPYTAEEDPEVDFIVDRRWILLGENRKYPVLKKRRYSELPYDCKMIVDDIVNASTLEMFQRWDEKFRRKYFTKAILMAYELGKENNKNVFTMIRGWFYSIIKFRTIC